MIFHTDVKILSYFKKANISLYLISPLNTDFFRIIQNLLAVEYLKKINTLVVFITISLELK